MLVYIVRKLKYRVRGLS